MRFEISLFTLMAIGLMGCGSSAEQDTKQSSIVPDEPTCDDITCGLGETCVLEARPSPVCFSVGYLDSFFWAQAEQTGPPVFST